MSSAQALESKSAQKWAVLAAVFVAQMLAIGSTSFGFGLFVKPVAEELGLARSTVNQGLMLFLVGMALASPIVGRSLDRFPARWILLMGSVLFGLGAVLIARADALWVMAVAMFLPLALGATALGPISASTLVARWFDDRRGRALGIAAVSMSVGGVLVVPAIAFLIEHQGWRWAVGATGLGIAFITALLALLAIPERPKPSATPTALRGEVEREWSISRLLLSRDFWLLVTAVGLLLAMSQALLSSIVAYGTDRGLTLPQATGLVTAISISSIFGKLLIGYVADFVDKRLLLAGVALLLEIFLGLLLIVPGYPMLVLGCFAAGAAIGGTSPVWTALISSRFGVRSFGTVMGLMPPLQMPLMLGGLYFIGQSYDQTGSYERAFALFAALGPVALIAALMIGRPGFRKI